MTRGGTPTGGSPPIDRASAEDEVTLATDVGPAPMHAGAVLVFAAHRGPTLQRLREVLEERIVTVPRLRRRLVRPPFGGGRAVWIDDDRFDLAHHVHSVASAAPGDEAQLFAAAAEALAARLSPARPRWRAVLVTGLRDDRQALVLVMHHVLADGIGGLAVLASLVDDLGASSGAADGAIAGAGFPQAPPSDRALRLDAFRRRREAVTALPATLGRLGAALRALRGSSLQRVARTSLLRPTGVRRRVAVVRVDLDRVHLAARAQGATVNDLVLVAVGAALRQALSDRGDALPELVASVPVSARTRTSAARLGNEVGAVPVRVPTTGDERSRLQAVAGATRRAKDGPRGASAAVLGPCFRALARVGLFRVCIERQRLVDTFVTNLRGPDAAMSLAGAPIEEVIPLAAVPGNVTVSFAVLSYAGTLGVTIIADESSWPDLTRLQELLADELGRLVDGPAPPA